MPRRRSPSYKKFSSPLLFTWSCPDFCCSDIGYANPLDLPELSWKHNGEALELFVRPSAPEPFTFAIFYGCACKALAPFMARSIPLFNLPLIRNAENVPGPRLLRHYPQSRRKMIIHHRLGYTSQCLFGYLAITCQLKKKTKRKTNHPSVIMTLTRFRGKVNHCIYPIRYTMKKYLFPSHRKLRDNHCIRRRG